MEFNTRNTQQYNGENCLTYSQSVYTKQRNDVGGYSYDSTYNNRLVYFVSENCLLCNFSLGSIPENHDN